ncbi:MAG: VirE protein [Bacteroidaceae bacterium]|nr:VirE protein [Bacteroidaceae bacterium]
MTFGIANNVKSQVVQVCTPELLRQAIDSPHVAQVCAELRDALERKMRGEITPQEYEDIKGSMKKQLPILTPHATFRNGRRKNEEAIPSGLSIYDLDHIPNPEGRWAEIAPRQQDLGIVMAHVTPSTEGLRLIFIIPHGMTLAQAQAWMAQQLGDTHYDQCVKDHARCSFLVPRDYILFMDEEKMFREIDPTPTLLTQKTLPLTPPQGRGVVTTSESEASDTIPSPCGRAREGSGGSGASVSSSYPSTYQDIPYPLIIEVLEEQMGGIPEHGSRNNFIFSMACHLRYVCNDDPEWVAQILPTYGENREKWMATIRSACNRNQTQNMPKLMLRTLEICKERQQEQKEQEENPGTPPPMPRLLPPLIKHLISKTPDIYKPAVAHAVFPALATHLWQTRFRYIDNVEHEATLMNVLMAGTGAGKNCISEPINRIMADIRRRDQENLRREREWKHEVQSKGANKDKRQRPEGLVIQEIDPDMTNAAFVQRLADAGDRFLYTKMNEIDQFDALKSSSNRKGQFQIMCLAFDPGNVYGQTRVGTSSVSERVCIRFNWNASTTILKGQRYFSQVLTDGPISRINFCTIPEREIGAEMPMYGTYDEAFDEELRPYIERLNNARGLVDCPQARALAKKLIEECADFSRLSQSRVYENLSYRANVIAYLKAMVLYVAQGERWDKRIEDFIRWSLHYDLWCKMEFFGESIEDTENNRVVSRRGPQNLLDLLPDIFTREEAQMLRQRMGIRTSSVAHMISTWKTRGYIRIHNPENIVKDLNRQEYVKTSKYLKGEKTVS